LQATTKVQISLTHLLLLPLPFLNGGKLSAIKEQKSQEMKKNVLVSSSVVFKLEIPSTHFCLLSLPSSKHIESSFFLLSSPLPFVHD